MEYTMKQFAEIFQTTEHTVRYYTDIGLLTCKRDEGSRRIYGSKGEALRRYFGRVFAG